MFRITPALWMQLANRGNFPQNVVSGMNAIGASVHLNAATQAIAGGGALASVSWDTLDFDTSGFWNAATPTFLTIPFTGLYIASASVFWSGAAGAVTMRFGKNSTDNFGWSEGGAATVSPALTLSYLFSATAGDEILVRVSQTSGGSINLLGTAGGAGTAGTFFSLLGFH